MKAVSLGVILAITATLAHAEDMAEVISRYRREHGLSAVKTDPQLTAIAERQAKAMAESGILDHSVAGSFSSRISGAHTGGAAENIAAGTKTWTDTFRAWQKSPGHNANLLQAKADSVGFAVEEGQGPQGRRGGGTREKRGASRERGKLRKPAHHDEEFRLQVSVLIAEGASFAWRLSNRSRRQL